MTEPKLRRRVKKVVVLDQKRQALVERVQQVNTKYQPRIDQLIAKRDAKTAQARTTIRDLTTRILIEMNSMTGGELGQLRITRRIKELDGR